MLKFIKNNKGFFIFLAIYLLLILVISPWGNFPINDDWDNQLQLLAFKNGDYRIHAAIDAAFILQPWLGYMWSFLFGASFVSLRVLTIIFSVFLAYFFHKIVRNFTDEKSTFLIPTSFLLHPLMLASSLTFMTEIYFLLLALLSYYYFNEYLQNKGKKNLWLGAFFCGLSILMRQLGFAIIIAYVLTALWKRKSKFWEILLPLLIVGFFIVIWRIYPRAGVPEPFRYSLVEAKFITKRLLSMLFIFPFLGFSLSPFFLKTSKKLFLFLLLPSLLLSFIIFQYDVLPLGNVFFVECLYCKTKFTSIFNNVPFKFLFSFLISFSLVNLVKTLIFHFKEKLHKLDVFTLLCVFGYYSILFFPEDIYDRYVLPLLMFSIIYIVKNISVKKISYFAVSVIFVMSFVLNWEYFRMQTILHSQMKELSARTGLVRDLYSVDTFTLYEDALRNKDYVGEIADPILGREFKCYVQSYVEDSDNFFEKSENFIEKYIENPQIYGRTKRDDIKRIKKHLNELVYNESYFSFLYNLVGKQAYVGSYCDEGVL